MLGFYEGDMFVNNREAFSLVVYYLRKRPSRVAYASE